MRKVRIGVIGAGSFSEFHLDGITKGKLGELVAISDCVVENAKKRAEEYGITDYYEDYHDLLARDDIEAVTLPLPDQIHAQIAIDALKAGKHVLCEKPMALNMEDCTAMIKAADETGKKLMIGQICRYTPAFKRAKELVESGEIGELFFVESEYAHDYSRIGGEGSWRVTPERHPVLGGGCHAMDLLRWIAGDPYEAMAYSNNKNLVTWPINDFTVGILKFPNNVIGKVMTSTGCKRNYTMRTVLYGTKGTIIVDNTSPTISLFKAELYGEEKLCGTYQHEIEIKFGVEINNHNTQGEIDDFCKCILEDKPVAMSGREGASTVKACLALVESAAKGDKVSIEYNF